MSGVRVQNLSHLIGRQKEEVSQIYHASFPPSERAAWAERVDSGSWFVAETEGRVVGLALVRSLSCPGIYLLEYMAVAEETRNQGIGSLLFRQTMRLLSRREGARGVLIEVEPEAQGSEQERRRIAFYSRNGAQEVPAVDGYCMPDLADESKRVPMKLMWFPLNDELISHSMLRACIVSIYMDVYKRAKDDPLLRSVLASLPAE